MHKILPEAVNLEQLSSIVMSNNSLKPYILDVVQLIYSNEISPPAIDAVLKENNIRSAGQIKRAFVDLIFEYIKAIVSKFYVIEEEKDFIKFLKVLFQVEEEDLYQYKKKEIQELLAMQFQSEYFDNLIDENERKHNSDLQELLGLGYDQFDQFKESEVVKALDRGAEIAQLDTALHTNAVSSRVMEMRKRLLDPENW